MSDNGCEESYSDQNKPTNSDHATSQHATASGSTAQAGQNTGATAANVPADNDAPLTLSVLRAEFDRQHQRTLRTVKHCAAEMLHEQLQPRDTIQGSMASRINVHGTALMEITSWLSELNSNKGGTHLKTRVDRLERQIVDYSFLLEGLARNDEIPLEMMIVNLIREEFGFDVQSRDIDLAVRFGSFDKKPRTVLVTMTCRWMKRSLIAAKKCLQKTNYKIWDFLPEEVLDLLHAANIEKLADHLEGCWPARGGIYLKFDAKSKPQHVASIKEFRTLMAHTLAKKASATAHTEDQNTTEDMDTQAKPVSPIRVTPKTPDATCTTQQAGSEPKNSPKPSTTQQTSKNGIDLPTHSPSDVTLGDNLPSPFLIAESFTPPTTGTPVKAEIARRNYATLWGGQTPLRKFSASVQAELPTYQVNLDEACFGFGDMSELNTPEKPRHKTSTPSRQEGGATEDSMVKKKGKGKFTTPPKMQFDKLHVKPVKSPLAAPQPKTASPASASSGVKPGGAPFTTAGQNKTTSTTESQQMGAGGGSPNESKSCQGGGAGQDQAVKGSDKKHTPPAKLPPNIGPNSPFEVVATPSKTQ